MTANTVMTKLQQTISNSNPLQDNQQHSTPISYVYIWFRIQLHPVQTPDTVLQALAAHTHMASNQRLSSMQRPPPQRLVLQGAQYYLSLGCFVGSLQTWDPKYRPNPQHMGAMQDM